MKKDIIAKKEPRRLDWRPWSANAIIVPVCAENMPALRQMCREWGTQYGQRWRRDRDTLNGWTKMDAMQIRQALADADKPVWLGPDGWFEFCVYGLSSGFDAFIPSMRTTADERLLREMWTEESYPAAEEALLSRVRSLSTDEHDRGVIIGANPFREFGETLLEMFRRKNIDYNRIAEVDDAQVPGLWCGAYCVEYDQPDTGEHRYAYLCEVQTGPDSTSEGSLITSERLRDETGLHVRGLIEGLLYPKEKTTEPEE